MVVTLGQQHNVGEKPTVILYTYINHHAQPPIINITTVVYCTIPLIAMQGYHTNTEDTGRLGYNSVCYITSRTGWVSLKRIYRYRCRRDPGKLYNNFCYTYLTKDQHPPSNLVPVVFSTIQCSTIEIMIRYHKYTYQNAPRPSGHKKRLGGIKGCKYELLHGI